MTEPTLKFRVNDPNAAKAHFAAKLAFTTGPAELKYMIEHGERPNIIDVRSADDYASGHIPGAVSLPEDEWQSLKGLSKDKANIVYCYSVVCHLAARAAHLFAGKGFPVIEMDGGMEYWRDSGYPLEKAEGQQVA